MNYLPDARNNGAEIFTRVAVQTVERSGERWLVHYQQLESGREAFDAPTSFVAADVVVLAAGALGSTEILLRSEQRGLPLSDRVGSGFSGNGDVLGFAYNADEEVDGIGFGSRIEGREPVGPCITGIIDLRERPALEEGMVIEDGAVPGGLDAFMPGLLLAAAAAVGDDTDPGDEGARGQAQAGKPAVRLAARGGAQHPDLPGHDPRRRRRGAAARGRPPPHPLARGRREADLRAGRRAAAGSERRARRRPTCATRSGPSCSATR